MPPCIGPHRQSASVPSISLHQTGRWSSAASFRRKGTAVPGLECSVKGVSLGVARSRFRQVSRRYLGDGRNGWMTPFLRSLFLFSARQGRDRAEANNALIRLGADSPSAPHCPHGEEIQRLGEPMFLSGPNSRRLGKGENLLTAALVVAGSSWTRRDPAAPARTAPHRAVFAYPSLTNGSGTGCLTCSARRLPNVRSANAQAPFPRCSLITNRLGWRNECTACNPRCRVNSVGGRPSPSARFGTEQ
jgi:hypothetical protein